jgi:multicomponent Na+:H+ antiporter subunit E
MAKKIIIFLVSFVAWLLLTWSLNPEELIAGAAVGVLITLLFWDIFLKEEKRTIFKPKRFLWFVIYLPVFFYYVIKANFDVAYRVLHPEMPINPGIVRVKTSLKTETGKTFLANSITLTPGTLTVDIVGDNLYVHWINISTPDPKEETKMIVARFEKFLKRICE